MRASLDERGCVAGDLSCIQCGYNLKTLHRDGKCPECGTAVERKLRGGLLCYSDPRWLSKIASGLLILILTGGISPICLLLLTLMIFVSMDSGRDVLASRLVAIRSVAAGSVLLLAIIASGVGLWLLSTPEPNRSAERPGERPRECIRLAFCTMLASVVALAVAHGTGQAEELCLLVCLLSAAVLVGALLLYVRRLAANIPSPTDSGAATALLVYWTLGSVFLVLGAAGDAFSGRVGLSTEVKCMALGGTCADCIAGFLALFLFNRVRREIVQITRENAGSPPEVRS
jgi:hypothetical protein